MIWYKSKMLWAAAILALAGGGVWFAKSRQAPAVKWRTSPVEQGPLQVTVTATGTLQAVVTVQVGTQVSGTVSEINADFNSRVKRGQVIARIDSTLLRAALSDALSNLEKTVAQERQAADALKRTQALFERALVSQSDLDQSVANASVGKANLSSAKAQVDRARINLRYATIVSPIDGTVLSRAVDVGQTVAASFNTPTLFTIAGDLAQMQVQASVDEADIGKVQMGQHATFTVDAYPDTVFAGEVKQIRLNPVVNQNVVSYDVVISVPNPGLRLMPGMTANLSIAVARKENALQVPAAALRFAPPDAVAAKRTGKKADAEAKASNGEGPRGAAVGDTGRGAGTGGAPGDSSSDGHRDGHRKLGEGHGKWGEGHRRDKSQGRVYVLEGGRPKAIDVRVGLSDGTHTEIEGPIAEGAEVVIGVEAAKGDAATAQNSPFGMPRMGGGGGSRSGGGGRGFH